jgi:hypothetical protein
MAAGYFCVVCRKFVDIKKGQVQMNLPFFDGVQIFVNLFFA